MEVYLPAFPHRLPDCVQSVKRMCNKVIWLHKGQQSLLAKQSRFVTGIINIKKPVS